jgi:peptide deformylase
VEGSELLARAIQHETDHLDGIVFIDRLDEQTRKIAMKDIRESDWFSESLAKGNAPKVKISPHKTFGKGL